LSFTSFFLEIKKIVLFWLFEDLLSNAGIKEQVEDVPGNVDLKLVNLTKKV
jgi:hypothetical protein